MRWIASLALGIALGIQILYDVATYSRAFHTFTWWYSAVVGLCFAALLVSDNRVVAAVLRVALGFVLLLSGLAELGLVQRAGNAAAPLLHLTQSLGFGTALGVLMPAQLGHAVANHTLASVNAGLQIVIGVLLVIGVWKRFFAFIAALLVALYGAAVLFSSGFTAVVGHALPVLFAGALVLAATRSAVTLTRRLSSKRLESDPFLFAFDEAQQRASRFRQTASRAPH